MFVLELGVIFFVSLPSLGNLVSWLIDSVFRIPSWLIYAYSGTILMTRYGPVRQGKSLDDPSYAMGSAVDAI